MNSPEDQEEIIKQQNIQTVRKIAEWMNEREFFWIMEVKEAFNISSEDVTTNKLLRLLSHLIHDLRRKNNIMSTETKRGQKQYMRLSIIDLDALTTGTGKKGRLPGSLNKRK